ncbi:MAG: hypothetical protein MUC45_05335 [Actinomycetia bacterium]|jgi:hypothetical protein|nr:hypothetical protein [Actinomycetes bacterium]
MTTIRATCPTCGDVELKPSDLRLVVCSRAEWSTYAFDCPACADEVKKPADEEVVALLVSGGVQAQTWHIPAEALEAHPGPALTYDDLLDFALWLDEHDALAAGITPAGRA